MGTCFSKKKSSSTSLPSQPKDSHSDTVTLTLSKPTQPPQVTLKNQHDPEDQSQPQKEIFIIKHRKSHDDREKPSKIAPCTPQQNQQEVDHDSEKQHLSDNKIAPSTPNIGVRTSSCTKEEVDAILIQCGRLSRSSSAKGGGRKYSGSKRSFDFDHCDNDTVSANNSEENEGVAAASEQGRHQQHQHRSRHRQSPQRRSSPSSHGRRRTPSREREQQQCSSRERRVSRSPGRRSSDTTSTATTSNANVASSSSNNNNTNCNARPGKMVSVPATVSSLVMDKSNNCESGMKRVSVKRNGGGGDGSSRSAASPRAQSPARTHGNVGNAKVLGETQQQQQPCLSRNNSSRKTDQSPYRRNPLSEVDANSLAYPQSNTNNGSSKVQNKPKIEVESNQKPNGRVALEKGVSVDSKIKGKQNEEESKAQSSVPLGVDNLKPQTLTRSRSSRRSRDLDINPEAVVNPTVSYTSLLLEDIQNFQKLTQQQQPSISLPACLTKACSILEAVADLNSTTTEDRRSPSTQQSNRNEHNVQLSGTHYAKKVQGSKDPFIESEVAVGDDVIEPSLHKYVTVKRGGSVGGVDIMEDQESSGSNSFTVSSCSGQQHHQWCSSSSWEPNSADSTDCWTSSEAKKKSLSNSKRKECDHDHSSGIGRGRLGSNKGLHSLPVAST